MKNTFIGLVTILFLLTACAQQNLQTAPRLATQELSFPASEWNVIPDEKNSAHPSVTDILARAAKVYADLEVYQDTGTIINIKKSTHIYGTKEEFQTQFDKQTNKFRFEFWTVDSLGAKNKPYVVWKNRDQVKTWWGLSNRVETTSSFANAIAGATGVSSNTAYLIPAVLIKEAAWKNYTWATNMTAYRISDAKENKVDYFRVQTLTHRAASGTGEKAQPESTHKETFWIRKSDYLLLRVVKDSTFPTFSSHEVVQYNPTINKKIADQDFEFGH